MMKRHWTLLLVGAILLLASHRSLQPLEADNGRILVTGGGQGTFGSDLDGDGDIDGSHFGIGVEIVGTDAKGHFTCLMAGNEDFLGLHLMLVEGTVESGAANPVVGSAVFRGSGTLHIDEN